MAFIAIRELESTTWRCFAVVTATLLCLAPAGVFGQSDASEPQASSQPSVVGSKVVGPGAGVIGVVEDVVVNQETGEAAMYLVKTNGWFGSYGVIPLDFVNTKTEVVEDGDRHFLLGVDINEATFDNLAKWDGEGPVGAYLRRYQSILSTVFGIEDQLEGAFDRYTLASRGEGEAVAMSSGGS